MKWKNNGLIIPSNFNELCIIVMISTGTEYRFFNHIIPKASLDPDPNIKRSFMGGTFFNTSNSCGYFFNASLTSITGFTAYWAQAEVTNGSGFTVLYR